MRDPSAISFVDLPTLDLQYRVEQLLARYAHAIDDDKLEQLTTLFTDDCVYQVISRENADRQLPLAAMYCASKGMLMDRITALRHANIYEKHYYRHLISNVLIEDITPTQLTVKSNYAVYRTRTNGATELFNAGYYHDVIVVRSGEWLFQSKRAVFDTHRIDALLVTPI